MQTTVVLVGVESYTGAQMKRCHLVVKMFVAFPARRLQKVPLKING